MQLTNWLLSLQESVHYNSAPLLVFGDVVMVGLAKTSNVVIGVTLIAHVTIRQASL